MPRILTRNNFYFTENKNYYDSAKLQIPTNTVYSLGQTTTYDIKSLTGLNDEVLKSLSTNNFIVEIVSISPTGGTTGSEAGTICWTYAASGFNVAKSYDNKTYTLSIGGLTQNISLTGKHAIEGYIHGSYSTKQSIKYNVYLIL